MKKTLLALLLTLSLLTGCGGSSDGANSSGAATAPSMPQESWDAGWAENSTAAETDTTGEKPAGGNTIPQTAKMIYTATLELETKEFDTALASLEELVSATGGYFENRELHQGGTYRSLYATVRVPAEKFVSFLDEAGNVAHMTYRSEDAKNVSEAYYDLEARLTTQRTKLQRLQELLAQAEDMEDIITIESAISETELQIEYLTGSLRQYDSLIGYSTVTVNLSEVYRLSTDTATPLTFGERMGRAFTRGLERAGENVEEFIIYLAGNWLGLLFWGGVLWGGAMVWLRLRPRWQERRRERLRAKSAPKAEDKKDGE